MNDHPRLRVGTRKSKLARWQANQIVRLLEQAQPEISCEIKILITEGDRKPQVPLSEMAGRGVFTSRVDDALRAGEIDIAVHSLKDLPTEQDPALCLAAVPVRGDPRECLVTRSGGLDALPRGAVIGTSSSRREAQLRALRPDLVFRPIRGNVDTRVGKVLDQALYDATVLAAAGIRRLGLEKNVGEWFPLRKLLPAPGQAALAVHCRSDDSRTLALLSEIDDPRVRDSVTAERVFLEQLGGGYTLPVAAFAQWRGPKPGGELHLRGTIFSPDGQKRIFVSGAGENPEELGRRLAERALRRGALQFLPAQERRAHPLAGRRIVVTRAAEQARYLTDRLRELGAQPVLVPVIRMVPVEGHDQVQAVIARLPEYDWIVFTSANAVANWWQLNVASRQPVAAKTRVAAVGPKTAAALNEKGVRVEVIPQEYEKGKLVEALGDVDGLRILLPRGELAGPALARLLEEKGAIVDEVVLYATLPVQPGREQIDQLAAGMDAVLFTSSSTVKNFVAALEGSALTLGVLEGVTIACIGPATARTAVRLGLGGGKVREDSGGEESEPGAGAPGETQSEDRKQRSDPWFGDLVVAQHYTTEGLVEALVDHYQESSNVSTKADS